MHNYSDIREKYKDHEDVLVTVDQDRIDELYDRLVTLKNNIFGLPHYKHNRRVVLEYNLRTMPSYLKIILVSRLPTLIGAMREVDIDLFEYCVKYQKIKLRSFAMPLSGGMIWYYIQNRGHDIIFHEEIPAFINEVSDAPDKVFKELKASALIGYACYSFRTLYPYCYLVDFNIGPSDDELICKMIADGKATVDDIKNQRGDMPQTQYRKYMLLALETNWNKDTYQAIDKRDQQILGKDLARLKLTKGIPTK